MPGHGGMGVQYISIIQKYFPDSCGSFCVASSRSADLCFDILQVSIEQFQYADKITGVCNIHCIGSSGYSRFGYPFTRLKIGRDHVISVAGRNESLYRYACNMCKNTSADITKVTTGHRYHWWLLLK